MRYVTGLEISHKKTHEDNNGYIDCNVNEGHPGMDVYIKPKLTLNKSDAATGFTILTSTSKVETNTGVEISRGVGGKYVYVVPSYDEDAPKIMRINLIRSATNTSECTENINKERKNGSLYLSWELESTGIL